MMSAAIAFCVPIASMVMIVPWMSTSRKSSGIAVISFDFSHRPPGQATDQARWPRRSPCEAAQVFRAIMAATRGLTIDGEDRLVNRLSLFGGTRLRAVA